MRVKRSVDFRMAPNKANKGKGAAAEPTREESWESSKCSRSDLESLVKQGFLPLESVIQWHPAFGDARPYENTGEIIGFVPYFERGLGLPNSNFFSRLLYYYWIQLHHLTPPHFFRAYICLRAFVRSVSGHRAPFRSFPPPFSS
jgi:hypothetical protein